MSTKATLSLKTVPLTLQAYKAKIKLVEPTLDPPNPDETPGLRVVDGTINNTAPPPGRPAEAVSTEAAPLNVQVQSRHCTIRNVDGAIVPSIRQPRPSPAPFVRIDGDIYPGGNSWVDAKSRAAALTSWRFKIAKEIAQHTPLEHDAAEAFVQSHRLSVANAFERRIVRGDVKMPWIIIDYKGDDPSEPPGLFLPREMW